MQDTISVSPQGTLQRQDLASAAQRFQLELQAGIDVLLSLVNYNQGIFSSNKHRLNIANFQVLVPSLTLHERCPRIEKTTTPAMILVTKSKELINVECM